MPTTLAPGDIAIVGYNRSGAPNSFTFINLVPLDPGTEIYFTTKGWTGTSLRTGNNEELIKFTVGSSKIPRGVVFNTASTSSSFTWTTSGTVAGTTNPPGTYSNLTLENPDQIIAFQSTNSSAPFSGVSASSIVYQLDYTGTFEPNPTASPGDNNSAKVDSLDASKSFVLLNNATTGGLASLSSFSGTKDQWLAEINNSTKWNNPSSLPLYLAGDYKSVLIPVNLAVSANTATEAGTTVVTVTATTDDGNASTDDSVVGNQTVDLTVSGTNITTGDYTLNNTTTNTVTITIPDGQTTGTATFKVVDDAIVEGAETATLTIGSPSSRLALGTTISQTIAITDNDTANIVATPTSGLTTTETGGATDFTVVLTSPPTANVTVNLTSSDTTEGTVSATSLTFTSANWNVAQTVNVTGVDDLIKDGDITYQVNGSATSGDPNYNAKTLAVSLTNTDNETAGVTVTPLGGLTTTEAGGTATFTVVLTSQPANDVTVNLASSDLTEGTVSTPIVFTTGDWNTPKTVTVTGVDDAIVDGNIAYSITGTLASSDGNYGGKTFTVNATNTDNDTAGGGSSGGGAPVPPPPSGGTPPSDGPGIVIDASRGIVIGGSGPGVNIPGISTVPTVPRVPVCPVPTPPALPVLPLPPFQPNTIAAPPTITIGRSGSDFAIGSPRSEEFRGNAGSDRFFGAGGNDNLYGDGDNDSLNGNAGDDVLQGGPGRDWVAGGNGSDAVWGGRDDDFLLGDLGADIVVGDLGNDTLFGDVNAGAIPRDAVGNPSDADRLFGGEGNDLLIGQNGDDSLSGGTGNDSLFGGVGKDMVWGDAGDDWLDGGEGDDTLIGGAGRDVFILGNRPGMVTILDFEKGVDRIAGLDFGQVTIESLGCDTRILLGKQVVAYLVAAPSDGIGGSYFFNT